MPSTHTLRKPVPAGRAHQKQRNTLKLSIVVALGIVGILTFLLIG